MNAFQPTKQQSGSVVMVALCFTVILGIALASYLAVSNQAMKLSDRSYLNSVSKNLAEMGLEQALWAYNRNNWTFAGWTIDTTKHQATLTTTIPNTTYGNGVTGTVNVKVLNYDAPSPLLAVHAKGEWNPTTSYALNDIISYGRISSWDGGAEYSINDVVSLPAGGKYRCIQAHSAQTPVLNSTTAYWIPLTEFSDFRSWYKYNRPTSSSNHPPPDANYWDNYTPTIYAEGLATPPASADHPIKTQVKGLVSVGPLFPNAAGATNTLILNGASTVDSYNSSIDPTAGSPTYSATLASTGTSNPAVEVDAATIQGYVAAFNSLTTFGGSASLKNKTGPVIAPNATAPNVDLTRVSRSPYVPQFFPSIWYSSTGFDVNDVTRNPPDPNLYICIQKNSNRAPPDPAYWKPPEFPILSATHPINITIGGGPLKSYTFDGSGDLDLDDGDSITIQGPVILDIRGDLRIKNGGSIVLQKTPPASAEIFFSGRLSVNTGTSLTGGIDNLTQDPKKLLLIGSASSTPGTNRYVATLPFYGVIYMPNLISPLSIQSNVYGAISAQSITFPSATNLHYDTALRTATYHSIDVLYVLINWRELTDPADQVTFP